MFHIVNVNFYVSQKQKHETLNHIKKIKKKLSDLKKKNDKKTV